MNCVYMSFNNLVRSRKNFTVIQYALDNNLVVRDWYDHNNVVTKQTSIRSTPTIVEIVVFDPVHRHRIEQLFKINKIEHQISNHANGQPLRVE